MNERHDAMYQAATQYYLRGDTMESIAHGLGLSRSSVSRLLSQARREGLVRITIADATGAASPEARALRDRFGVAAHLVNVSAVSSASIRLDQVAQRAASLLTDAVHEDGFLGVAWGVTMASLARHLPRHLATGQPRSAEDPISIVGASVTAGQAATLTDTPLPDRIAMFASILASVNLFLALFNLVPLPPLDGGHIVGALWEGLRRSFATLTRRPDPGPVDTAKMVPIAYAVGGFLLLCGVVLIVADIVSPVKFF